ncbi:S41 family peptidase [Amycolatopsis sp. cg5]|uniref:S41 family peptidase n=1 Tax=Amycolatopsis sp. cg5 TaxID=3238802 RepID=UPI0035241DE3
MTRWSAELATISSLLLKHYAFPEVASRIVASLGDFSECLDEQAFAEAVTPVLRSVNGDKHLTLDFGKLEPMSVRAARDGHGVTVSRLPDRVALVEIRRFWPASISGAFVTAAMSAVADASTLILDLRRNVGGEPDTLLLVASCLFDRPTALSSLYFPSSGVTERLVTSPVPGFGGAKPVFVLTSASTFSGGEALAYDLQQCGRATVVGETTAGGANFGDYHAVTDQLDLSVPDGYPVNPISGTNWEGVGVRPDIPVPAADALKVATSQS